MTRPPMSLAERELDRKLKHDRIVRAAVEYVYDKNCRSARIELDRAVVDLIGSPLEDQPPVIRRRE